MSPAAEPAAQAPDDPGRALAEALCAALPGWVAGCVERTAGAAGLAVDDALRDAARAAADAATAEVGPRLRALLAADVDDQRANPLALVRAAVPYPTAALAAAGVPPAPRDEFRVRSFPDDLYDLAPATWADIDPALVEVGIAWGAWKAREHLLRHRPRG